MSDQFIFRVYDPPKAGLPFLAVMITHDGEVTATPYDTAAEAQVHSNHYAAELHKRLHGGEDDA